MMKSKRIAVVCYAAMLAMGEAMGDEVVVPDFSLLPEGQQNALISSIDMLLEDSDATESARHDAWMAQMLADGWVHGKKKDDEAKTHPRLVEFSQLTKKDQAKEKMLLAVVRAIEAAGLAEDGVVEQSAAAPAPAVSASMVMVRYIGKKDEHKDSLYGTHLEWKPDEEHAVPMAVAMKMRAHTDTYQIGEITQAAAPAAADTAPAPEVTPDKLPVPLPQLDGMDKTELTNFAQQHYGEKFAEELSEDEMRSRILAFVQARGR